VIQIPVIQTPVIQTLDTCDPDTCDPDICNPDTCAAIRSDPDTCEQVLWFEKHKSIQGGEKFHTPVSRNGGLEHTNRYRVVKGSIHL
jgi:hypothetical protein